MLELAKFLNNLQLPGDVLFAKVWGSRSHNCQISTSDWDFSGVYIVPTMDLFRLKPIKDTIQKEGEEKPDYSFHEVGKFCDLLLKGNPGILEMLFTENLQMKTKDWEVLYTNRRKFLSKQAITQYLGYAQGQLKRLMAGSCLKTSGSTYNTKWAYHLLRLLGDAHRIATGGYPVVWKEGEELEHLMDVRNGVYSPEEVQQLATQRVEEIRAMDQSHLPDYGDRDFLEKWLVGLRLERLECKLPL